MGFRINRPDTAFELTGKGQKRKRATDDAHLKFIRALPCVVTGAYGVEAAHIRFSDTAYGKRECGKAEKPDDRWTVPLSPEEHRKQHSMNEIAYWKSVGIDPLQVASALHHASGDTDMALAVIRSNQPVKAAQL